MATLRSRPRGSSPGYLSKDMRRSSEASVTCEAVPAMTRPSHRTVTRGWARALRNQSESGRCLEK